jgi:NADH-quinone oxidoreductase subunit G
VAPSTPAADPPRPERGRAVLSTWHLLLDLGRLQDGEPYLAGTAHKPVARLSPATAAEIGLVDGQPVRVATDRGEIVLPAVLTPMPDRVVWVPTNSPRSAVRVTLGADSGTVVSIAPAGAGEQA